MRFEWDTAKNASDLAKHGIDFEDAIQIFQGPTWENTDSRREYGKVRTIALGAVDGRELVVVYTVRGEFHTIISARRANSRERKAYREAYSK